jgi:hypothetical protein
MIGGMVSSTLLTLVVIIKSEGGNHEEPSNDSDHDRRSHVACACTEWQYNARTA